MLFQIFVDVCLPILILIGLGWGLDRLFDFDLKTLVKLNLYLFVPAFILVRLSTSDLAGVIGLKIVAFTVSVILSMGAISWIVCAIRRIPPGERYAMKLSTMIYNCGNWGIPLMTLAFSELGAVVQVFVLATMNLTGFSLGIFLANAGSSDRKGWFLPILKQPSPYAILTALILRALDNPLENIIFVWTPLSYLADGLVAFALLTLGVQLAKTRPPAPRGTLGITLFIRLIGGPLVATGLTWLFGFQGEIAAILIVGAAAPTAVNTALLAHEFKADHRFAAAAVLYSTLFAAVIVTGLLAMLRAGWVPWAMG
ncbi:MAG: AEC family transporter [Verrucomicrobiales bacterium]|jgi:predicted permease|nr:AEC family transporter [Verrucomicrobiales bacterium]MDP4940218.1 AEC family transporter [Verrucomicrobiales bacterium]MDP5004759.1 AEC family transporter [Verrucomicrobiales bacterium]